ncbi:MAG: hypothetical protein QXN52_08660 [Nitrososphaerota archaeon]
MPIVTIPNSAANVSTDEILPKLKNSFATIEKIINMHKKPTIPPNSGIFCIFLKKKEGF